MTVCWKCHNPVRSESAVFCPMCGSAIRQDQNTAKDWAVRLQESGQQSHWALSFLWWITGPGLVLVYPALLKRASGRLAAHHRQRMQAPAFASPRFVESPQGKAIASRFSREQPGAGSVGMLFLYLLMLSIVYVGFVLPAFAPTGIRYADAQEAIIDGRLPERYFYINNADEYERAWQEIARESFIHIEITSNTDDRNASSWDSYSSDTPSNHRPYRFIDERAGSYNSGYSKSAPVYRHVEHISVYIRYGQTAHVLFIGGIIFLYVVMEVMGVRYWLQYNRHVQSEAVAAAFARGDIRYHDELMAKVRGRNSGIIAMAICLAVVPFAVFVTFPIIAPAVLAGHQLWEKKQGIPSALGFNSI